MMSKPFGTALREAMALLEKVEGRDEAKDVTMQRVVEVGLGVPFNDVWVMFKDARQDVYKLLGNATDEHKAALGEVLMDAAILGLLIGFGLGRNAGVGSRIGQRPQQRRPRGR